MARFTEAEKVVVWERWQAGDSMRLIARQLGRQSSAVRTLIDNTGGVRPQPRHRAPRHLSVTEREEISRGLAAPDSLRAIAHRLGRPASTVCREVNRNGGRARYRAHRADRAATRRASRPKVCKLVANPQLRRVVEEKLALWWSPQQISGWLRIAYPADPEMWVSHETIYLSLFVQGRGALRHELTRSPRIHRAMRRPRTKRAPTGKGQIRYPMMISERPAEAEDRAVPGHWEGDLFLGRRITAIGTLVERQSRYVMLFPPTATPPGCMHVSPAPAVVLCGSSYCRCKSSDSVVRSCSPRDPPSVVRSIEEVDRARPPALGTPPESGLSLRFARRAG